MARKPKQNELQPGQLIRVASAGYHNVKSGALVRAINISKFDGDLLVKGPCKFPYAVKPDGGREMIDEQFVEYADVLHIAKERRPAHAAQRGSDRCNQPHRPSLLAVRHH